EPLETNYRSGRNIVEFNNRFFLYCAGKAQELYDGDTEGGSIRKIYEGFQQKVSKKGMESPGCVDVEFVADDGDGFEAKVLEMLPSKIEELLAAGYLQKDIAVLVRKGTEGNMVAQKLIECGYDIISSDSLYIGSSPAVQKVVNVLREMDNPQSDSLKILRMFQNVPHADQVEHYSLYQLCEAIIRESLLPQEQGDVAFLQAFLDLVLDFTARHGTNIAQFLKWWDESGVRCTISAPDDMDAIRIMTIHKSKGLGFNVVIIPFLTEGLDHKPLLAPNLWCSYKGYPVAVKYGKALLGTEFEKAYLEEKLCAYIDALNTVYVAFTRPKQGLVVFARETAVSRSGYAVSSSVSDILFEYYREKRGEQEWNGKIMVGQHHAVGKHDTGAQKFILGNAFSTPIDEGRVRMAASSGNVGEGESVREHGIAMHYVFSMIEYGHDVEEAVARACREGVFPCSEKDLLELVYSRIASVEEYGWFSPGWKVYNECSILTLDGQERRPDRVLVKGNEAVVIDYKFGAYTEGSTVGMYKKQVSRYKELLTGMGFTNVKGYLWYPAEGIVISV
ncbi:MAG: hypothetical protein IKB26_02125, partial [Bacteroidales bacterium]|nr:hypothetical protein [Bacteroidales bacterium]